MARGLLLRFVPGALSLVVAAFLVFAGPAVSSRRQSLGSAGTVLTRDLASAVAIQADGKLVVAGESGGALVASPGFSRSDHFALARYTADGRLDPRFGRGGKVLTAFGSSRRDAASAVAIQADGKVVAAGRSGEATGDEFALARYTVHGRLDSSFGHGGKVLTDFPSSTFEGASAVAIQADGKIVAAGVTNQITDHPGFALARYSVDGRLDPTFGRRGKLVGRFGDWARAVAIQPDGKLVAAGLKGSFTNGGALARYTSHGRLDPSFGRGGKVLTGSGSALALAIQPDGKVVVAGAGSGGFALARYTSDGRLDPSFGHGGKVEADFGMYAFAVAIQADGKIVAAGRSRPGLFALARFTADGSLDSGFGRDGTVLTRLGSGGETRAVAIQTNRKVVAVGWIHARSHDFALARYKADGRLDSGFGRGGKVLTNFGSGD